MATYNYSTITPAQAASFNPLNDTLNVDFAVSANTARVTPTGSGVTLTIGGKTTTFANLPINQITPTNIVFANGSAIDVGDLALSTNDDQGNVITTTGLGDLVIGLGGNDTINSGALADVIYGNSGGDAITAAANSGADSVFGGTGADTLNYALDTSAVLIYGNAGADIINGGTGSDRLFGGAGNDILIGNGGNDRFAGGAGADTITGGAGNDLIYGNSGADVLAGGTGGADTIYGGTGADTITSGGTTAASLYSGGAGADSINVTGNTGNDTINGGIGNDTIVAGNGNNVILGGAGADSIVGGTGADTITGGIGADTMTGGAGADRFVIGATDSGIGAGNYDRITDFSSVGGDALDLTIAGTANNTRVVTSAGNGYDAAVAAISGQFTAGTTYIAVNDATSGNQYLFADYNGDQTPDAAIQLDGGVANGITVANASTTIV